MTKVDLSQGKASQSFITVGIKNIPQTSSEKQTSQRGLEMKWHQTA